MVPDDAEKGVATLPRLLRLRAEQNPEAPFLFFKSDVFSRRELLDAVLQAAGELNSAGIRKGDRVALLLPNGPEFIVYYFASMELGAIAVPVNTALKAPEIAFILKDSGAKAVLLGPAHYDLSEDLRRDCPELIVTQKIEAGKSKQAQTRQNETDGIDGKEGSPRGEDPAAIIYTSGTTGFPKGAVLSHANYLADAGQLVSAIGMNGNDRFLCFLPLFHVNGQVVTLLSPLLAGGSIVLMERFAPKEFFELLSRHRCTAFSGVPSVYAVLLNLSDSSRYDLSSLRFCICGAAPMPVEVFEKFEAKFKAHILEGYGLSEGTCASSVNPPPPGPRKVGSIGLPLKGQEMKIVGEQDQELPDGSVGEIVVRGPTVMKGYWNNPGATADAIRGEWLHTGDLGLMDKDGYFFIVGRKKEMIIRGGENIYPKEIEEALYRHAAVAEAAVVGLPDKRWGEEVAAFLVLKEGSTATSKEILAALKDRVADYKLPRLIEFVSALPKTATGKIQKLRLRDEYLKKS